MVSHFKRLSEQKKLLLKIGIAFALLLILVLIIVTMTQGKTSRTEKYKDTVGVAGLDATIMYDCKDSCDKKYDFNVYVFRDDGSLMGTFRPNQDGKIQAAVAEGDYTVIIGKKFEKGRLFPQELLQLKNGKTLEVTLQY